MTKLSEQIINLRNQNKTYSEIKSIVGCSKSTIGYHLGDNQKTKNLQRTKRNRLKQHPFVKKIESFSSSTTRTKKRQLHQTKKLIQLKIETFSRTGDMMYNKPTFTVDDVLNKFGETPKCYLTGQDIDISQPRTYQFDHIIPRSRGGTNNLDNLAICTSQANQSKRDMTPDEFFNLCKIILENQGYLVSKLQDLELNQGKLD